MAVKKELLSDWWLQRGLVCAGGARVVRRRHQGILERVRQSGFVGKRVGV